MMFLSQNLRAWTTRTICLVGILVIHLQGCGRAKLSEREIRREQIRLNAENKKRELSTIKGDYAGTIDQALKQTQSVTLHLDVSEEPFNDNGGIDPIMMPQLSGFLKFPYGSRPGADEYLGFKIIRGEFDPKRGALELVVNHEQYGEMKLSLSPNESGFTGSWQALTLSLTGTMSLVRTDARNQPPLNSNPNPSPGDGSSEQITGQYSGFADDETHQSHFAATVQLRSTNTPQGLVLTADVRLARGGQSSEIGVWKFHEIAFNPLNGRLTLRKDGVNESFVAQLNHGTLSGEWFSAALGRMGALKLSKSDAMTSPLPRTPQLTGNHDVCLKNYGSANLPHNASISINTTPDLLSDGKIKAQSSLIFYLGDYGSTERATCVLEEVEIDFVSGRYHAVCRSLQNTEPLTITGQLSSNGFTGKVSASGSSGADASAGQCQGDQP